MAGGTIWITANLAVRMTRYDRHSVFDRLDVKRRDWWLFG
jgi:hypothetical protein